MKMNMNEMNTDSLLQVYAALKDRYSLMLTNTAALDDGFDMDCSIIVGKAHGRILYLYEYYGEFVLDVMDESKTKGTHWHPWDTAAAIEDVASFMEGKEDYRLKKYGQSS